MYFSGKCYFFLNPYLSGTISLIKMYSKVLQMAAHLVLLARESLANILVVLFFFFKGTCRKG